MKNFLFTILFMVAFLIQGKTQSTKDVKPNSIQVGIGPVLFGYGDITGIMQFTEFRRQLLPFLQVSAGFSLAQASSTINSWRQAAAKTLDFTMAVIPVRFSNQNLKIGVGVSGRNLTHISTFSFSLYDRGPNQVVVEEFEKQQLNSIGYTALLEYEYLFGERWALGTRATFQNYRFGSAVLFVGVTGGIRF